MVQAVSATAVGIASRSDVTTEFFQRPIRGCRTNGGSDGTGRLLDAPLPRHFELGGNCQLVDWNVGRTVAIRHDATAHDAAAVAGTGTRNVNRFRAQ
jgi:hypothetical protein